MSFIFTPRIMIIRDVQLCHTIHRNKNHWRSQKKIRNLFQTPIREQSITPILTLDPTVHTDGYSIKKQIRDESKWSAVRTHVTPRTNLSFATAVQMRSVSLKQHKGYERSQCGKNGGNKIRPNISSQ